MPGKVPGTKQVRTAGSCLVLFGFDSATNYIVLCSSKEKMYNNIIDQISLGDGYIIIYLCSL